MSHLRELERNQCEILDAYEYVLDRYNDFLRSAVLEDDPSATYFVRAIVEAWIERAMIENRRKRKIMLEFHECISNEIGEKLSSSDFDDILDNFNVNDKTIN